MQIFRISQNIEYLDKLGVPAESQQEILNYLMSLDKDIRKIVLRKIKKNPSMNLKDIRDIETDTKKDYLRGQGYDEKIVDIATMISPEYSVWLAREIKKFRELAVQNYNNYIHYVEEMADKYNVKLLVDAQEQMTPEERIKHDELRSMQPMIDPKNNYLPEMVPWQSQNEAISVIDYIKQNNPDIMSMPYDKVLENSVAWHEELKQRAEEETAASYKSHNVVYTYPNKWEIVKLESGDCKPEGDLMGHCVGGYAEDVANGSTEIYSLRDEKNRPHVTIEMSIYNPPETPLTHEKPLLTKSNIEVRQIQGKGNDDPADKYKIMIKEWFESLKQKGYDFDPMEPEDYYGNIALKDLRDEMNASNIYGIPVEMPGIGGDAQTYFENLQEAYQEGHGGAYWYKDKPFEYVDDLINYAEQRGELNDIQVALEGFSTKTRDKEGNIKTIYKGFNELANEWWMDAEPYYQFENPRPDEEDYPQREDFTVPPDVSPQQPELEGMPQPETIFDEEAYNKAVAEFEAKEQAYEEELGRYEEDFEPYIFQGYVYEKLKEAEKRKKTEEEGNIVEEEQVVASKMRTRIYKMAEQKTLSAEASAQYVDALHLYSQEHPNLDKKYADLIKDLPSPRKIRQDFSMEECKILYETLDYLWKKITGDHIIQEKEVISAPETLFGNYWLLKNGILLKGVNHFSIIKNNATLFCTLLNLNGMTLQEYLCNRPHKVIEFILNNGGVRLFVNKDKKLYAQMSSETYGKWGKSKIKKYDFKLKAVKVIDFKRPYTGWKSGITIKL